MLPLSCLFVLLATAACSDLFFNPVASTLVEGHLDGTLSITGRVDDKVAIRLRDAEVRARVGRRIRQHA